MIAYEDTLVLFQVNTDRFIVKDIDNTKLAQEILLSKKRLSDDPRIPLFEDTEFNPKEGDEGHKLLNLISQSLEPYGLHIFEKWSQIHQPLESTGLHHHIGNNIVNAFVYYVKVPPGAGILTFELESGFISSITPSVGELYIFPSWIKHKVSKNLSSDIRISVSGNLSKK
jgi:hypothetical protein